MDISKNFGTIVSKEMGVVTIMGNGIKQIFVGLFCSILNGRYYPLFVQ